MKESIPFPELFLIKVNVIARLEFELIYSKTALLQFNLDFNSLDLK